MTEFPDRVRDYLRCGEQAAQSALQSIDEGDLKRASRELKLVKRCFEMARIAIDYGGDHDPAA